MTRRTDGRSIMNTNGRSVQIAGHEADARREGAEAGRRRRLWAAATLAALGLVLGTTIASAQDHRGGERGGMEHAGGFGGRGVGPHVHLDGRFQHNQYYPARGAFIGGAPRGGVGVEVAGEQGGDGEVNFGAGFIGLRPREPEIGVVGELLLDGGGCGGRTGGAAGDEQGGGQQRWSDRKPGMREGRVHEGESGKKPSNPKPRALRCKARRALISRPWRRPLRR